MLAMESLPAMARLSLHECAPTGARDEQGRVYSDGNCQKCMKEATRVYAPKFKYCLKCNEALQREKKRAEAAAAAEAAKAADEAEKARLAKEAEEALKTKKAAKG